jgi:hypothetical protein
MSQSALQDKWLPYLSQIPTAIVAVVAIPANRRSSKETLTGQLNQRIWERRTEIYLEMIRQTEMLDPSNLKTPKRRLLTLTPELVARLRQHRARQAEAQMAAGSRWRDYG